MATEIERKFLVVSDAWRNAVAKTERLRDGLVAASDGRKIRVRLYEGRATLTMKTKQDRGQREEFEYEIPWADALRMLELCHPNVLEKTRHDVMHDGLRWEVDIYEGLLDGFVTAEVELTRIDQPLMLPEWVGREVTGLPEFKKSVLLRERLAALRS